jgi:hypothetical protein
MARLFNPTLEFFAAFIFYTGLLFALYVFAAPLYAAADVQFISNVDDYNLNCTIQTSAGNMVALVSTPNSTAGSFQIARVDVSGPSASLFLLTNATYDNIYSSTFTVDPVLKRIMVMTQISGEKHVLVYSTLNGTLLNDVVPSSEIFMFAINLHDSTVYALSMIDGFAWLGTLDTTTGVFTPQANTTASSVLSPSQSIDFVRREYAFFSSDGISLQLHRINLLNNSVNVTSVNASLLPLSPVSLHDGKLYMFVPIGSGANISWKLGTLNIDNMDTAFLALSDSVNGFLALPRAFDFVGLKMYTPLSNASVINSYDMNNGSQTQTSVLPDGYKIEAGSFEQECICCLQQGPLRFAPRFSLSQSAGSQSAALAPVCTALTSSAELEADPSVFMSLFMVTGWLLLGNALIANAQ